MIVIEIIQYSAALIMIFLLSYQLVESISALIKRGKVFSQTNQDRRFAIVMSATKDKQMISQSLYSLFGLVYPKNMYDVIISDDCLSDEVVKIAEKMGVIILNGNDSLKNNGDCKLQRILKQIIETNSVYDAILVIESEGLVSGNYLDIINYYLDRGSEVIQSSSLMLPEKDSGGYERRRVNFLLQNLIKPIGQKVYDFSTNFRGGDFCFSTQMLRKNVELLPSFNGAMESGMLLQLQGIDVDFAPEAVVWKQGSAEKEEDNRERNGDNGEWISLVKCYFPKLFKAAIRDRSLSYLKKILDLLTPPVLTMLVIAGLLISLNIIGWMLGGQLSIFIWVWLSVCILGMLNIFVEGYAINTYFQAYKSII